MAAPRKGPNPRGEEEQERGWVRPWNEVVAAVQAQSREG
jgi:hypothetical protein